MKYTVGDILYYVNPFVYIIEKIRIEFVEEKDENGQTFYVDNSGAYLQEDNLFLTLDEAKLQAHKMLMEFTGNKAREICKSNPKLEIE
jgi:hypothetical protein